MQNEYELSILIITDSVLGFAVSSVVRHLSISAVLTGWSKAVVNLVADLITRKVNTTKRIKEHAINTVNTENSLSPKA